MNRFAALLFVILWCLPVFNIDCFGQFDPSKRINSTRDKHAKPLQIMGRVVESLGHKDLVKSMVYINDSEGNRRDSVSAGGEMERTGNGWSERAFFLLYLPRVDSIYRLEVVSEGYTPYFYDLKVKNVGKRELGRSIDDFVLHKAPKDLAGVTVTASKVKFYNRGDTLVYNADAFELADGSMLDVLVRQLPGVELRDGGRIYVNGEFVENLVLNGKDFFKGNNEVMLDNLAAYTVKQIEVYKKESDFNKWAGFKGEKQLTMDVKLKKEYNQGWLVNMEGGGGTSGRYMGRAFVNRYTNHSRISIVGNANNLNDSRKPGESTSWTPESNTTGTKRTLMGGLDYFVESQQSGRKANGSVLVTRSVINDSRDVARTNFLNGGNTYDYSYSRNRFRDFSVRTNHEIDFEKRARYYSNNYFTGHYGNLRADDSYIGAVFNRERGELTKNDIETLYSGTPAELEEVVNRNKTSTLSSGYVYDVKVFSNNAFFMPKTTDKLILGAVFKADGGKNELWRDYEINYGANPVPSVSEKQYYDESPNRNWTLGGNLGYGIPFTDDVHLIMEYEYSHSEEKKDSYMYVLERWGENGVIGTLPQGWLNGYDASGSYRSRKIEDIHKVKAKFAYFNKRMSLFFEPELRFTGWDFRYFRGNEMQTMDKHFTNFILSAYSCRAEFFSSSKFHNESQRYSPYKIELNLSVEPVLPDPSKMVSITDDNDPLNIYLGNPDLKEQVKFRFFPKWRWTFAAGSRLVNNTVWGEYSLTRNSIVNGYVYDSATGIRHNKTYNVKDGNRFWALNESANSQFGSRGQFTVDVAAGLERHRAADMIGRDMPEPEKSSVHTWIQNYRLRFDWTMGKQKVGISGMLISRTTDSDRADFTSLRAKNSTFSANGVFKLPGGIGISTDFSVYVRRGYGNFGFNGTDPVWNMRATYTLPKGKWTVMLDGFDILHRLSSVQYSVNAQGRTIAYTNVLPRYFMLHLQYKVNVMPKKKMVDTFMEFY